MSDMLTMFRSSKEYGHERVTLYVPNRTAVENYLRKLAVDIFRRQHELRLANISEKELTVLVPAEHFDEDTAQEVHGGTIVGLPVQVVAGIDQPMLAYPLAVTDIP